MQIGCINPQVDIMGAELPGYNGCILVYIGIMDVLKKSTISKPLAPIEDGAPRGRRVPTVEHILFETVPIEATH